MPVSDASPSTSKNRDLVVVIGTTGVGKSDFAVDLGRYYEDVLGTSSRADLYVGLPLITNKITKDEERGIEHWGVGIVQPVPASTHAPTSSNSVTVTDSISRETVEGGIGTDWGSGSAESAAQGTRRTAASKREKEGVELQIEDDGSGRSWELGKWCNEAEKKIASTPNSTLPIICGGTHYYIQHFLFPPPALSMDRSENRESARPLKGTTNRAKWTPPLPLPELLESHSNCVDIDSLIAKAPEGVQPDVAKSEMLAFLDSFYLPNPIFPSWVPSSSSDSGLDSNTFSSTQSLATWNLLDALDSAEAGRWHWRDGRKVKRGIERWWETQANSIKADHQSEGRGKSVKDVHPQDPVARRRVLMFWLYEPLESLGPRLDKRIDRMLELGLLEEVKQLRAAVQSAYGSEDAVDLQEGIFQSIGFKEFAHVPSEELDPANPALISCLDRMKLSTRQYAKSQLKWIRKQLLPAIRQAKAEGQDVHIYVVPGGLTGRDVGRAVFSAFIRGAPMPEAISIGHPDSAALLESLQASSECDATVPGIGQRQALNSRITCSICSTPEEPVSIIRSEWTAHERSKGHKRALRIQALEAMGPDPYKAVREAAAKRRQEKLAAAVEEEAKLAGD